MKYCKLTRDKTHAISTKAFRRVVFLLGIGLLGESWPLNLLPIMNELTNNTGIKYRGIDEKLDCRLK